MTFLFSIEVNNLDLRAEVFSNYELRIRRYTFLLKEELFYTPAYYLHAKIHSILSKGKPENLALNTSKYNACPPPSFKQLKRPSQLILFKEFAIKFYENFHKDWKGFW